MNRTSHDLMDICTRRPSYDTRTLSVIRKYGRQNAATGRLRSRTPFPMHVSAFRGMGAGYAHRRAVHHFWRHVPRFVATSLHENNGTGCDDTGQHAHIRAHPFRYQKYNLLIKNICAHSDIREGFSS